MEALGMAVLVTAIIFGLMFAMMYFSPQEELQQQNGGVVEPPWTRRDVLIYGGVGFALCVGLMWFFYQYIYPFMD